MKSEPVIADCLVNDCPYIMVGPEAGIARCTKFFNPASQFRDGAYCKYLLKETPLISEPLPQEKRRRGRPRR